MVRNRSILSVVSEKLKRSQQPHGIHRQSSDEYHPTCEAPQLHFHRGPYATEPRLNFWFTKTQIINVCLLLWFLKPLCFGTICQMNYWKDWRNSFNSNHIATLVWLSWGHHKPVDVQRKGRKKREREKQWVSEMSCLQQRSEYLGSSRTVAWLALCQSCLIRFRSSFWSSRGSSKEDGSSNTTNPPKALFSSQKFHS